MQSYPDNVLTSCICFAHALILKMNNAHFISFFMKKASDISRTEFLPVHRQFYFLIKLSTNHAERAPWHSFYVMHLKLQLHPRNYISGAEQRTIQPHPIVGITHDNKKAPFGLFRVTQVIEPYYGIRTPESTGISDDK